MMSRVEASSLANRLRLTNLIMIFAIHTPAQLRNQTQGHRLGTRISQTQRQLPAELK